MPSLHPKVKGKRIADITYDMRKGEVSHFYVYPFARKQGYGQKLLRMLETKARIAKRKKLTIWVAHGTASFYKHHGYKIKRVPNRKFPRATRNL